MRITADMLSKHFTADEISGMLDDLQRLKVCAFGRFLALHFQEERALWFEDQHRQVSERNLDEAVKSAGHIDQIHEMLDAKTGTLFPGLEIACKAAIARIQANKR